MPAVPRTERATMSHLTIDACDEAVKQFVLSLAPTADGFVLELGGRPVVRVLPVPPPASADDWDNRRDARRCELIDREIAGTLSPDEATELHALQAAMLRHRRRVAPLPLAEARRLHQELLAKAAGPAA
jgi:hypothetical protein